MLDSSSTLDQIKDAYADNASYAEDGSATKAKAFITACRLLLLKLPNVASKGGESLEFDRSLLRDQIEDASRFVAANDTGTGTGRVGILSVRGFSR